MSKIIRQKKVRDTRNLIRPLMQKMGRPFVVYIYKIMVSRYERNMCNDNFTMWAPSWNPYFLSILQISPQNDTHLSYQHFIHLFRFYNLLAFNLVPYMIIFFMFYRIRAQNAELCLKESKRIIYLKRSTRL